MWFSRPNHGPVIANVPQVQKMVISQMENAEFDLTPYTIDIHDYHDYIERSDYQQYTNYYNSIKSSFAEKTLEHYLAMKLLDLNEHDVYIDIANARSPTPEIYQKLHGCKTYRQDLIFEPGFHGDTIGGDASAMPLPNGFASAMALHCSFEHFEGDTDIRFIREAKRVLIPGGRMCILPLYTFFKYAIQTDPKAYPDFKIEEKAIIYHALGWGNRHGRFYDVPHLINRVRNNLDGMKMKIYIITNEKKIDFWPKNFSTVWTSILRFWRLIQRAGLFFVFLISRSGSHRFIARINSSSIGRTRFERLAVRFKVSSPFSRCVLWYPPFGQSCGQFLLSLTRRQGQILRWVSLFDRF